MVFYYINNSDRSADVQAGTLRIQNQIQQRTDSCNFTIFQNAQPDENQDIKIYDGGVVSSHAGTSIVLKESYQTDVNQFYAGQILFLDLASAVEKATVASYNESTRTITLTSAPTVAMSADDTIGEIIFGGIVARVKNINLHSLANIEYDITGVDYTKVFDKKVISDSWVDLGSRYIINDFVNTTVNYNETIDNIDYDNDGAIQAEWLEAGDGDNPTINSSDFLEGDASGVFPWTFSGGTATWAATPTSKDISVFTGASSGAPTKGELMGWFKTSDQSDITTLKVRLGSASGDYADFTITLTASEDWQYIRTKFTDAAITGTPDWTAVDYALLEIVQTASGQVQWNGLRVNDNNSFTLFNVDSTPDFDDIRAPQIKPMMFINQLAKQWQYVWHIDYEHDIHFKGMEETLAVFEITDTSDNFIDLKIEVDTSNLGNRIIVRGGEKESDSTYSQVFQGDEDVREWLVKNKFKNLVIKIDNNSSTDTAEAGTTTTNITAVGHGLITGDWIVNRTRGAAREIVKVNDDNFTVKAVASQTSGDTFSLFSVSKTSGIEGIVDETTVDYVQNSSEKSVRATDSEGVLTVTDYIQFIFNERVQIQVRYSDGASANALKALGLGDGLFDLDTVTNRNVRDLGAALLLAKAKVTEFSNPIIKGSFKTDQKGLKAGQLLHVVETTNRNIDKNFVIQTISKSQTQGAFKDYFEINVRFATTLFGWIEFMQKLLLTKEGIELNVDGIVETYITANEFIKMSSVDVATITSVPWQWEVSSGQGVATRWDLFEYG